MPAIVMGGSSAAKTASMASCSVALIPARSRDDDGELIATEAGDAAVRGQRRLQARGDLLQQLIARRVAQDVVGVLEAVDVDQSDGELAALAGRLQHRLQAAR